jgi:hypothetical protein
MGQYMLALATLALATSVLGMAVSAARRSKSSTDDLDL